MKILVGVNSDGHFKKVGVFSLRKDGSMSLPSKLHGSLASYFIRSGERFLKDEVAANFVDYQAGTSPTYRISRI